MKTKQFYHKLLLAKATRTGTKERGIANIIALLGTVMRMLLLAFVTMAAQKEKMCPRCSGHLKSIIGYIDTMEYFAMGYNAILKMEALLASQ